MIILRINLSFYVIQVRCFSDELTLPPKIIIPNKKHKKSIEKI